MKIIIIFIALIISAKIVNSQTIVADTIYYAANGGGYTKVVTYRNFSTTSFWPKSDTVNSGVVMTKYNADLAGATLLAQIATIYQPMGTYATASNTMTFTNKSGNISQWANDNNYITSSSLTPYKAIADSGRGISNYATGYDVNKIRDSVQSNIPTNNNQLSNGSGYITASSSAALSNKSGNISMWTNDADYLASADLPIGKADNSTKGIVALDSNYFNDNGSGIISFNPTRGTGTVSASAVTINQPRGSITLTSPSILAGATLSITFTNSFITSTSTISIQVGGSGNTINLPIQAYVKSQTSGSCIINILNISLLSTFSNSITIDFLVVN